MTVAFSHWVLMHLYAVDVVLNFLFLFELAFLEPNTNLFGALRGVRSRLHHTYIITPFSSVPFLTSRPSLSTRDLA